MEDALSTRKFGPTAVTIPDGRQATASTRKSLSKSSFNLAPLGAKSRPKVSDENESLEDTSSSSMAELRVSPLKKNKIGPLLSRVSSLVRHSSTSLSQRFSTSSSIPSDESLGKKDERSDTLLSTRPKVTLTADELLASFHGEDGDNKGKNEDGDKDEDDEGPWSDSRDPWSVQF